MKVLLTSQVFPPETHPTAVMVGDLASYLAENRDQVSVAVGYPHHPLGTCYQGYSKKRLILREVIGGTRVARHWHLTSKSSRLSVRMLVMVSQSLAIASGACFGARPKVVVNFGPPLLGPVLTGLVAKLRRAKSVSVVYDLYPDILIKSQKLRGRFLIGVARFFERLAYQLSDRVVVLSEGFRRALIERGVEPEKIDVIPVWLDPAEIRPLERNNSWRDGLDLPPESKVILYAGTIGLVSGAEVVLDAASQLRGQNAVFLFVGEGQVRSSLEREAGTRGLSNVRFLPFQPRELLPEVQAASDISLVTLAPGRGRTSVPSKVVGYMAAGRPIVASVDLDSDTAESVRAAGGVVVEPGNPDALASAIRGLLESDGLAEMGRAARSHFERTYARDSALKAFELILQKAAGGVE